jgi:inactivated superfamily I helicase
MPVCSVTVSFRRPIDLHIACGKGIVGIRDAETGRVADSTAALAQHLAIDAGREAALVTQKQTVATGRLGSKG